MSLPFNPLQVRLAGEALETSPLHLRSSDQLDALVFAKGSDLNIVTCSYPRPGLFCLHRTIRGASNDRSTGNCSHHVHHLRSDLVDPHHDSLAAAIHADCPRSLRGDLSYMADLFTDATGRRRRVRASLHPVKK